jgi:hypothetical protein
MAKIVTQTVVITVSQLVKDGSDATIVVTDDIVAALEGVAAELLGDGVVVEVETV